MTIDRPAAAEALAEIAQSQERSAHLYAYTKFAPYLMLTGAMWLTADVVFQLVPTARAWIWPAVTLVSTPLFILIAARQAAGRGKQAGAGRLDRRFWRGMATWLLISAFVFGTFAIFWPVHGVQTHSFAGLLAGVAYAIAGLWLGRRVLGIGLAVAALTMVGHFYVREYYTLYMGVVGGGGMMLAGFWLRQV